MDAEKKTWFYHSTVAFRVSHVTWQRCVDCQATILLAAYCTPTDLTNSIRLQNRIPSMEIAIKRCLSPFVRWEMAANYHFHSHSTVVDSKDFFMDFEICQIWYKELITTIGALNPVSEDRKWRMSSELAAYCTCHSFLSHIAGRYSFIPLVVNAS